MNPIETALSKHQMDTGLVLILPKPFAEYLAREVAVLQTRYENECAESKSRLERIQSLERDLADSNGWRERHCRDSAAANEAHQKIWGENKALFEALRNVTLLMARIARSSDPWKRADLCTAGKCIAAKHGVTFSPCAGIVRSNHTAKG